MLLGNCVLKQRESIPRYGNTINNSILGTACSNIFCENYLFKNIFKHLSTKLVGKEFFFSTSFRYLTSSWKLEKSKTIENIRKSIVNIKPCLYSSAIKLLKLE